MANPVQAASGPECLLCRSPLHHRHSFGDYRLAYCPRCRLGRLDPLPTPEVLDRLYGSQEYFSGTDRVGYSDYDAAADVFRRTFHAKLDLLTRTGPVENLLELGCGPGLFLEIARQSGIPRVLGLDPNPWAIDFGRRKGLDLRVGSVDQLAASERFDAAVMLDVLEHVAEPLPFLEALGRHLPSGGRLLVMTPNISSWLARISGRRWVSFKIPEHLFYYSPTSIRLLLDRCGFDVVDIRSAGQYVTVDFFLDRLARIARPLAWPLQKLSNTLGWGERVLFVNNGSMDVVARKR